MAGEELIAPKQVFAGSDEIRKAIPSIRCKTRIMDKYQDFDCTRFADRSSDVYGVSNIDFWPSLSRKPGQSQ